MIFYRARRNCLFESLTSTSSSCSSSLRNYFSIANVASCNEGIILFVRFPHTMVD